MAYDDSTRRPDDEEEQTGAPAVGALAGLSRGSSSASSAPAAGSSPTGFVSFGQYFDANRGAAERMGQQAANDAFKDTSDAATGAESSLNATYGQFQNDVSNAEALAQPTTRTYDSGPTRAGHGSDGVQNMSDASIRAVGGTPDHSDLNYVDAMGVPTAGYRRAVDRGTYGGPSSFDAYDPGNGLEGLSALRSRFGDVATQAQGVTFDPGAVQGQFARQNKAVADYTQGAGALDGALGSKTGQPSFQALQNRFTGIGSELDSRAADANALAAGAPGVVAQKNREAEIAADDFNKRARELEEEEGY